MSNVATGSVDIRRPSATTFCTSPDRTRIIAELIGPKPWDRGPTCRPRGRRRPAGDHLHGPRSGHPRHPARAVTTLRARSTRRPGGYVRRVGEGTDDEFLFTRPLLEGLARSGVQIGRGDDGGGALELVRGTLRLHPDSTTIEGVARRTAREEISQVSRHASRLDRTRR